MKEFKKDLNKANELRLVGKNREALEIFEKCYKIHPEEFSFNQRNDYAWAVYKTKIQFFKSEEELLENAQLVTELIPQLDFNTKTSCVYTSSVFKVLNHFKDINDFPSMIPWLERLNPELLDEKPYWRHGRLNKSHKELYYFWASKAYYQSFDFEKCIEVSKTALDTLNSFMDDGDSWHFWRIGKSLIELGYLKDALTCCERAVGVLHKWYMYRDIAEIYLRFQKYWIALDYLCPAVLSKEPNRTKANVYLTCYRALKSSNPEMALKHAQLYCLLRRESGYSVAYEIERLNIDEALLNRSLLEQEIRDLWIRYRFKNQKLHHGKVVRFNEKKGFGFIKDESDGEIFFHKSECNFNVFIGQVVSFFTEESFDKSKNRKSLKAVNVRGESGV